MGEKRPQLCGIAVSLGVAMFMITFVFRIISAMRMD